MIVRYDVEQHSGAAFIVRWIGTTIDCAIPLHLIGQIPGGAKEENFRWLLGLFQERERLVRLGELYQEKLLEGFPIMDACEFKALRNRAIFGE